MRVATVILIGTLLAGCGAHHGGHYAIVSVASPESSPRWVRMDTVTGDMLLCRLVPSAADATAAPPPTGFSNDPAFACTPATPGGVAK